VRLAIAQRLGRRVTECSEDEIVLVCGALSQNDSVSASATNSDRSLDGSKAARSPFRSSSGADRTPRRWRPQDVWPVGGW